MPTTRSTLAAALAALALIAAACGGSDSSETDGAGAEATDSAAPVEESTGETTDDAGAETAEDADEPEPEPEADNGATAGGPTFSVTGNGYDLSFSPATAFGGDYRPVGNDFSAFDVFMSPEGEFFPALVVQGIPRDISSGDVISLNNPVTATEACVVFQESIDMATSFIAVSAAGTLTIEAFDGDIVSGSFEAELVEGNGSCVDTVGEAGTYTSLAVGDGASVTVSGSFSAIAIPVEE